MGSSAIAVREESRHSAELDRHPDGCVSCLDEIATDRCDELAGNGQVLSATPPAQATQATTQIDQEEVGLHQLWFALSHEQRAQFGGHFSELLLRAVRQENDFTSIE